MLVVHFYSSLLYEILLIVWGFFFLHILFSEGGLSIVLIVTRQNNILRRQFVANEKKFAIQFARFARAFFRFRWANSELAFKRYIYSLHFLLMTSCVDRALHNVQYRLHGSVQCEMVKNASPVWCYLWVSNAQLKLCMLPYIDIPEKGNWPNNG